MTTEEIKKGYAHAAGSAKTVKRIAQAVSGFFATVGLYYFFKDSAIGWLALPAAMLTALTIEKLSHRHGMSHFYNWQKFGFKKDLRWLSFLSWAILILIFISNPLTSYMGSEITSYKIAPEIKRLDLSAVDSVYSSKTYTVDRSFTTDSARIENKFKIQRRALAAKYAALIAGQKLRKQQNEARHLRGAKWAKSHMDQADKEIAAYQIKKTTALSDLESLKATELTLASTRKDSTLQLILSDNALRVENASVVDNLKNKWSLATWLTSTVFMKSLAIGSSVLTFLTMWFITRYMVKSGIEPDSVEFNTGAGFVTKLYNSISDRISQKGQLLLDLIGTDETEQDSDSSDDAISSYETERDSKQTKKEPKRSKRDGGRKGKLVKRKKGRISSVVALQTAYDTLLKSGAKVTRANLAKEAKVSTRTVTRYMDELIG